MPTWEFGHMEKPFGHIEKLTHHFETLFNVDIDPRYLKQHANTEVPMHADNGTQTCINIVLSDNYGPITFEDIGDVHYTCALLDVKKKHMIRAHDKDRWLFNLSILEKTYDECVKKLPNSLRA